MKTAETPDSLHTRSPRSCIGWEWRRTRTCPRTINWMSHRSNLWPDSPARRDPLPAWTRKLIEEPRMAHQLIHKEATDHWELQRTSQQERSNQSTHVTDRFIFCENCRMDVELESSPQVLRLTGDKDTRAAQMKWRQLPAFSKRVRHLPLWFGRQTRGAHRLDLLHNDVVQKDVNAVVATNKTKHTPKAAWTSSVWRWVFPTPSSSRTCSAAILAARLPGAVHAKSIVNPEPPRCSPPHGVPTWHMMCLFGTSLPSCTDFSYFLSNAFLLRFPCSSLHPLGTPSSPNALLLHALPAPLVSPAPLAPSFSTRPRPPCRSSSPFSARHSLLNSSSGASSLS